MNYIRKALERLPGRWYKGGLGDGAGNWCGIGHLQEVAPFRNAHDYGQQQMDKVAEEQYPDRLGSKDGAGFQLVPFAAFNDHPDTTEDEVIAVMEKAAILWDETCE